MQNFMKTIINAIKIWIKGEVQQAKGELDGRIKNSVADWNESDKNADSYIKNKPDVVSQSDFDEVINEMEGGITNAQNTANAAQVTANDKMDATNPVGTGSFSLNRRAGTVIGKCSHAEGDFTTASGKYSHAEGYETQATTNSSASTRVYTGDEAGYTAHAEGYGTVASGAVSHAEGGGTAASGKCSHAEGSNTSASGGSSHAEGYYTIASGSCSHTEGSYTKATQNTCHAEGYDTIASEMSAHAEGVSTVASGQGSHAEGVNTTASGDYSHAEGRVTTAQRKSQHAQGEYNILDTEGTTTTRGKYVHIVGNGIADHTRSNAHTLDWDGNAWYSGDVYVGSASGKDKDEGSKKLATEEFVSSKIAEAELGGEEVDLSGYALKSELPSRVSQLQNDSGYITGYTETDPTVPAWAKAAFKPTYTASEVGADSKGTASSVVSAHNTATDAHNDIRLALKDINDRLNAFFDSDDKTLDELSEIVTYITSNKALIDSITTSKVSVSDIINNLTTNVSNKPLSAAQGVVLKGLIDTLNSGKLDASALSAAINTALAQAKASGEFDGKDGAAGATGVGIKSITI